MRPNLLLTIATFFAACSSSSGTATGVGTGQASTGASSGTSSSSPTTGSSGTASATSATGASSSSGSNGTGAAGSGGAIGSSSTSGGPPDSGLVCSSAVPCPTGDTCCGGYCTNISKDPQNCGACAVACSASQFCTGTACSPLALQSVCASPDVTVLLDVGDNDAGEEIGASLVASCTPAITVAQVQQSTDAGIQNPATGAPIIGAGDLLIAAGGPDVQTLVGYLERASDSPVYFAVDGGYAPTQLLEFVARDGGVIGAVQLQNATATHDIFVLEMVIDPISATPSLVAYGFGTAGTLAAAWYFDNVVLPTISTASQQWMVVSWTADGGTNVPSPGPGDSFDVLGQGQ